MLGNQFANLEVIDDTFNLLKIILDSIVLAAKHIIPQIQLLKSSKELRHEILNLDTSGEVRKRHTVDTEAALNHS
jgi:hypothetical protein